MQDDGKFSSDRDAGFAQPSDLVLEIPFQLDAQSTAAEKSPDGMTIEILDANRTA
jgi:hypothetical protein